MRIHIEPLPFRAMTNSQCGNWQFRNGALYVQVADTGDWRSNLAVAVHEAFEALKCLADGVPEAAVDEWDRLHADNDGPGAMEGAPYREQHLAAERIERLIIAESGDTWEAHEARIDAL